MTADSILDINGLMRKIEEQITTAVAMPLTSGPGLDQITYSMVKAAHSTMQTLLLNSLNKIFSQQALPTDEKPIL